MSQDVKFGVEGFEAIKLVGLVAGLDEGFKQVVESSSDAIAQEKFVVAGEAVENGDVPADEVVGFLDDGEFGWQGHRGIEGYSSLDRRTTLCFSGSPARKIKKNRSRFEQKIKNCKEQEGKTVKGNSSPGGGRDNPKPADVERVVGIVVVPVSRAAVPRIVVPGTAAQYIIFLNRVVFLLT